MNLTHVGRSSVLDPLDGLWVPACVHIFCPGCLSRNAGLEVDVGERRVISSVALEAEDLDSTPNRVYYFVNAVPRVGKLQLKVRRLGQVC